VCQPNPAGQGVRPSVVAERTLVGRTCTLSELALGERSWTRVSEKPSTTSPIMKRINAEQFIDRLAALYIGETDIIEGTSEGKPKYPVQKCHLDFGVGKRDQV